MSILHLRCHIWRLWLSIFRQSCFSIPGFFHYEHLPTFIAGERPSPSFSAKGRERSSGGARALPRTKREQRTFITHIAFSWLFSFSTPSSWKVSPFLLSPSCSTFSWNLCLRLELTWPKHDQVLSIWCALVCKQHTVVMVASPLHPVILKYWTAAFVGIVQNSFM